MYLAFLIPKYADSLDNYELVISHERAEPIHSYKYNRNKVDTVSKEHFKYEMLHLTTLCLRL